MPLDPERVVRNLKELRTLTGDENGAQRVAWTETWARGRAWLADSLSDLPLEVERDEAGNDWYTLRGERDDAVLIGGHMDSVPNGGWLDGCLNVLAGAEVLRHIATVGTPPVTVRLVDWADEEGARFGRSLFGSSAAAGSMADQAELEGPPRPRRRVAARRARSVRRRRRPGPRRAPSARDRPGVPRAAHRAGAGPGDARTAARRRPRHLRRRAAPHHVDGAGGPRRVDADGPAPGRARRRRQAGARAAGRRRARRATERSAPPGGVVCRPGIVTSVVETAEQLLDQRHLDAAKLAAMLARAKELAAEFAAEERHRRRVGADLVDRADPVRPRADRAVRLGDRGGVRHRATASPPARCTTRPRSPGPACRR